MNEAMIALLSRPAVAEMATPLEQVALLGDGSSSFLFLFLK